MGAEEVERTPDAHDGRDGGPQRSALSRDLRLVILECPLAQWRNPLAQHLFQRMVELKVRGYERIYKESVLPVDGGDLVGTHLLVCKEPSGRFPEPISGYREVSLSKCREYGLDFPALTILNAIDAPEREIYLRRACALLAGADNHGGDITYGSAWTIHPHALGYARACRDLMTTTLVHRHGNGNFVRGICCGVLRVGTDKYFQWLGGKPITDKFSQRSLRGEAVVMFALQGFSGEAEAAALRCASFWEDRLVVSTQM